MAKSAFRSVLDNRGVLFILLFVSSFVLFFMVFCFFVVCFAAAAASFPSPSFPTTSFFLRSTRTSWTICNTGNPNARSCRSQFQKPLRRRRRSKLTASLRLELPSNVPLVLFTGSDELWTNPEFFERLTFRFSVIYRAVVIIGSIRRRRRRSVCSSQYWRLLCVFDCEFFVKKNCQPIDIEVNSK